MRFYAYNPMAGGLLTGRYRHFEEAPSDGRFNAQAQLSEPLLEKELFRCGARASGKLPEQHGITSVEATYRWLAYHSMLKGDRGDAILIGASKLDHLKQNLKAVQAGTAAGGVWRKYLKRHGR